MGVTYEQLTGDLAGVTFSSIRAGLIEFRRGVRQYQFQVFIFQFCQPVWERWMRAAVLSGRLELPGFAADPRPWLAVKWVPPGFEYVNPVDDVQADNLAVKSGFKSRSDVVAERGDDAVLVDEENAEAQKRAEALGLSYDTHASGQLALPLGRTSAETGEEKTREKNDVREKERKTAAA